MGSAAKKRAAKKRAAEKWAAKNGPVTSGPAKSGPATDGPQATGPAKSGPEQAAGGLDATGETGCPDLKLPQLVTLVCEAIGDVRAAFPSREGPPPPLSQAVAGAGGPGVDEDDGDREDRKPRKVRDRAKLAVLNVDRLIRTTEKARRLAPEVAPRGPGITREAAGRLEAGFGTVVDVMCDRMDALVRLSGDTAAGAGAARERRRAELLRLTASEVDRMIRWAVRLPKTIAYARPEGARLPARHIRRLEEAFAGAMSLFATAVDRLTEARAAGGEPGLIDELTRRVEKTLIWAERIRKLANQAKQRGPLPSPRRAREAAPPVPASPGGPAAAVGHEAPARHEAQAGHAAAAGDRAAGHEAAAGDTAPGGVAPVDTPSAGVAPVPPTGGEPVPAVTSEAGAGGATLARRGPSARPSPAGAGVGKAIGNAVGSTSQHRPAPVHAIRGAGRSSEA